MNIIDTDVLVVGGGSAALRATLEAARAGAATLAVDKGSPGKSGSSPVALVGFSGLLGDEADSEQLFLEDWVKASGGICDRNLVIQVIRQGPAIARDLEALGLKFISNEDGTWFVARRAGHSAKRTVMVKGHANAVMPIRRAAEAAGARFHEGLMVTRLLHKGVRVVGAMAISPEGTLHVIRAKATVLAAGGANRLYPNPAEEITAPRYRTLGDSYALAFQAGVPLVDMEFCQFRDSPPAGPIFGAHYHNALGERIMLKYDPVALETAPRHMMAKAVYTENMEGRGPVTWTVLENQVANSRAPVGQQYAPGDVVPIVLQFQRLMGGARIDESAATSQPGFFAAGESAGGIQGGDRMQGCGFCETQVFGGIAGRNAAAFARAHEHEEADGDAIEEEQNRLQARGGSLNPKEFVARVQTLMWEKAGVVSEKSGLSAAAATFERMRLEEALQLDRTDRVAALEAANLVLTAELVTRAKLAREESRSAHHRSDFPATEERWVRHVTLQRRDGGRIAVGSVPVNTNIAPVVQPQLGS